jgi:hypothetical protein
MLGPVRSFWPLLWPLLWPYKNPLSIAWALTPLSIVCNLSIIGTSPQIGLVEK